ncbi:uncharacterized protein LOC142176214 [Nicotiana tabacum]|uniref:Uncharacterized protein LOC142176214 n=1 Tax=Nicotiana tabacum TaxID=4097 RepID=A0AC58TQD6_TOBAC
MGGIFRNYLGNWIIDFQKVDKAFSPLHAELQAIHEGLQIAISYDLFPLKVETDSTEAINVINQDHFVVTNTVHACRSLMLQRKDLLLRHNFQEENQVAHLLAKDACKKEYIQLCKENAKIHPTPPHFVSLQLSKDVNGGYYYKKSLDITTCNRLKLVENQNVTNIGSPMCGDFQFRNICTSSNF